MAPALLILAAGRGSRFGGPKQLAPVGPNEEPLLAYTIHDAARAGFGRVVLVCPPGRGASMENEFLGVTGGMIDIIAVEQPTSPDRTKPSGTGHAVLQAAEVLSELPFAVANGDDWYGPEPLAALGSALGQVGRTDHVIVTYKLAQSLAHTGGVSRGQCELRGTVLLGVREVFNVREVFDAQSGASRCEGELFDGQDVVLEPNTPVSMNLWGFVPPFLELLGSRWQMFRDAHPSGEREFLLPEVVTELIESGKARIQAIPTNERPFGLTRPEDLEHVSAEIARLVESGAYPADLRAGC